MSSLPDISIRRPVFAWMLMIGLILFGAISFRKLGISQLPDVDFPVLSVQLTWEGAAPEVLESEVADRLEQAIISVEAIRDISSTIRQGQVAMSVEFELHRDIDAALQEVQAAISRVRLPVEVDPSTITKTNPEDQPIIWLGVSGKRSLHELITYVDLQIRDQFQILPGVGEVVLGGFTERSLKAMNKDRVRAAREGAEEISFAAIAASIAVVAIFLPVAFMKGVIGKFFFQFGVTITAAVMLSLLEAVTLTPMRCSQLLSDTTEQGWFARFIDRMFFRIANLYRVLLKFSLRWRWFTVGGAVVVFILSLRLAAFIPKEFIPAQDQSIFLMRLQRKC